MRSMLAAIIVALSVGAPAMAKDAAASVQDVAINAVQNEAKAARTVYICDNTAATRHGFAREFGKVEYVTAQAALAKGEAWAAPKCITAAEARRLQSKQVASAN